jgi:Saxitoxin biosynthesis operon protein SxtJ
LAFLWLSFIACVAKTRETRKQCQLCFAVVWRVKLGYIPAMSAYHEKVISHDDREPPSLKSFGLTFVVVFALIGLSPMVLHHLGPRYWALAVSSAFLVVTFVAPNLLKPLNQLWFRFGMVLHKIINPLVLGLMFVVVISPIALVLRLLGKRLIPLKPDAAVQSYWITRQPPGPAPESLRNQF